jgi:PAS domain S-box-containing protein
MPLPFVARETPTGVRLLLAGAAAAFVAYTACALIHPASATGTSTVGTHVAFPAVFVLSGIACLARGARPGRERAAWLLFGTGQIVEAFGWLSYELVVRQLDPIPAVSVSDVGWLGGYLLYLGALVALLRARAEQVRAASSLDGPVAALASAAVAAAFLADGIAYTSGDSMVASIIATAYPVVDLVFLVLLAVVFAVNQWRPTGVWMAIAAAVCAHLVADTVYLHQAATGSWELGGVIDAGWPLAATLIAGAAWLPRTPRAARPESPVVHAVPLIFAVVALSLVVYDHFARLSHAALALAALALIAGGVRSAAAYAGARGLASERAALERTASILRAAGESIYMIDSRGIVTYANPATERTLGYAPGELIGRNMHEVVHHTRPDGSPYPVGECPIFATLYDGRDRRVVEDMFWRKDGTTVPVEYTVTPIVEDGEITGAATVFSDVTQRRRAERNARAQHAVAQALTDAGSLEAARGLVLRAVGECMDFDAALAWVDEGEAGGLKCTVVWTAGGDRAFEDAVCGSELAPGVGGPGRAMSSGRVKFAPRIGGHLPPAARRIALERGVRGSIYVPITNGATVLGVAELVGSADAEPDAGMLEALRTVGAQVGQHSARRRAETEADRMKNEFFALVSHELRTPLTSIVGYLDLVLDEADVDAQTRQFLTVVERNSRRLLRLVGDLLFVAQIEGGETSLDVGAMDLGIVAAESVEAAAPRAREAAIELVLDADKLPVIQGDAGRMAQAIDNLVSNAIKFTPDGGQVRVALRMQDGSAVVEVSDTGIGIPPAEQQRLFDRFFRSSVATERAIQGVGLGLTIVKAIVEGHDGSIEVESAEGEGTTFRAYLPLRPAPVALSRR